MNTLHPTCNITAQPDELLDTEHRMPEVLMYCPNCGSKNYVEGDVCDRCVGNPVEVAARAEAEGTRVLAEKFRSGRRNAILGILLLLGACLIVLILMSKGVPAFLAFLWTCWIFLWGVIAFGEGASAWFSSRRQIKTLAYAVSQHRDGTQTGEKHDQRASQPDSRVQRGRSVED